MLYESLVSTDSPGLAVVLQRVQMIGCLAGSQSNLSCEDVPAAAQAGPAPRCGPDLVGFSLVLSPVIAVTACQGLPDATPATAAHTDAQLWSVLARVGIEAYVRGLPSGLDAPVEAKGQNLSVGQVSELSDLALAHSLNQAPCTTQRLLLVRPQSCSNSGTP